MRKSSLVLAVGLVVLGSAVVSAQAPNNWAIAVSSFSTPGNAIVFFDEVGGVSTVLSTVPLPANCWPNQQGSDSIELDPTNSKLVVADTGGTFAYDMNTGTTSSFCFSTGITLNWGCYGEEGEYYAGYSSGTNAGKIFKYTNEQGGSPTTFATASPGTLINTICWDGGNGGIIAGLFGTGGLQYFAKDGTPVKTVAIGSTSISGVDWNSWDGSVLVSWFGGLSRVDAAGTPTTLVSGTSLVLTNNAVEVDENPAEFYYCAEFGGTPRHLTKTTPGGTMTSLYAEISSPGSIGPSDLELRNNRILWGTNQWRQGQTGNMSLNFGGTNGNDFYQCALAFGHQPGVNVGAAGTVHLTADPLLFLSILLGPPIFNNFGGQLNANGQASPAPNVALPATQALIGLRIYGGAIAYNAGGIQAASNCWGTTIQP